MLGVVSQHQVDLAQGALLPRRRRLKGFASVGYSGPNDTPNTWANIFTNPVTLAGAFGVLGPCGALDQALDVVLGPDPLPVPSRPARCPGSGPRPSGAGPATDRVAAPRACLVHRHSAPLRVATSALGPSTGAGGLAQLLEPLAGGDLMTTTVDRPTTAPCAPVDPASGRVGAGPPAVRRALVAVRCWPSWPPATLVGFEVVRGRPPTR